MTPAALIMLVLTVVIVWGGLVAATVALRILPTPDAAEESAADPQVHSRG
ncbi:methionine/alanine import family NSS transporter small subunit [Leucobacter sp. OH2974_COT-288]|nr:methionine/alanine import family NSS transporter small subunit [Leucobacter sp. OH2974_COT-288]